MPWLYRDEVVATPGVSCGLDAAYRAVLNFTRKLSSSSTSTAFRFASAPSFYGAQQVCTAFLHRPLGDVGLPSMPVTASMSPARYWAMSITCEAMSPSAPAPAISSGTARRAGAGSADQLLQIGAPHVEDFADGSLI